MSPLSSEAHASLAPLRRALFARATSTADDIRGAANEQADALVAEAQSAADSIREQARVDGETSARADAALTSARARRQAHDAILAAQNSLRDALLVDLGAAATALRHDPRYPDFRTRLEEYARGILGPDALVSESPAGGIIAEAGSLRLDLTLPVLALDTASAMPRQISSLWAEQSAVHDGA